MWANPSLSSAYNGSVTYVCIYVYIVFIIIAIMCPVYAQKKERYMQQYEMEIGKNRDIIKMS